MKNNHRVRKWGKCVSCLAGFVASLATIAGLVISVCVFRQTQRIHEETQLLNENMQRTEYIRYARECLDRYLMKPWHDMAIKTSNNLNDSLRAWGMEPDSTCHNYFKANIEDARYAGEEDDEQILMDCIKKLR
ncbi:MAG: hypothetical protein NC048_03015 [Bacteroides sp.]|nr:hypothetical protein [Ruminococcus flavefaciens]MCM1554447.1 hypothetical protein [Bacteroides sp.]